MIAHPRKDTERSAAADGLHLEQSYINTADPAFLKRISELERVPSEPTIFLVIRKLIVC
jgi:hypothetical protein